MAIEKVKVAQRAAQPTVISMVMQKCLAEFSQIGVPDWALRQSCDLMPSIHATSSNPGSQAVMERQRVEAPYPSARVIVLDDDHNTFQHVVDVLVRHIPAMTPDRAWELAHRIDGQGSAVVWSGPLEQAELYHQQLSAEGLTMAPLERC